ncbi:MAG: helix-turn-helix transcriptional regulator [Bacteroidota bacterium]
MAIEKKIKAIISAKGITMKSLIEKVGMTQSGFYKALDKETMQIKTLKMVAKELGVTVGELLGEEGNQVNAKYEALLVENHAMKEKIESSLDLIKAYKKIIQTYEQADPNQDTNSFKPDYEYLVDIIEAAYKSSYFRKVKKTDKRKFHNLVRADPKPLYKALEKLYSESNVDEYDIVMGDLGTEEQATELKGKYVYAYFQKVVSGY